MGSNRRGIENCSIVSKNERYCCFRGASDSKGIGVGEERTLEGNDLEDLQASEKQELLELFSQELDKQGLDGGFDEDGSLLGDLLRAQICWKRIWTKNMNNIKSHWKTKYSSSV